MHNYLADLRATLEQVRSDLFEAEAELADRLAEVTAFELEFEARVGRFIDQLEWLEAEIERYHDQIQMRRNVQVFGSPYLSVEAQYRRAWQAPPPAAPTPPAQPPAPADESRIRQLYRQLARRFHPDLARDDVDRAQRTRMMVAVNMAYAARSLAELVALASQPDAEGSSDPGPAGLPETVLISILEEELARCQRRLKEIERELRGLPHRPSVQLSLEVKLARRRGRDLLAEMAAEIEHKVARRTVERDMLKVQFDQLGPDQGIIRIK